MPSLTSPSNVNVPVPTSGAVTVASIVLSNSKSKVNPEAAVQSVAIIMERKSFIVEREREREREKGKGYLSIRTIGVKTRKKLRHFWN